MVLKLVLLSTFVSSFALAALNCNDQSIQSSTFLTAPQKDNLKKNCLALTKAKQDAAALKNQVQALKEQKTSCSVAGGWKTDDRDFSAAELEKCAREKSNADAFALANSIQLQSVESQLAQDEAAYAEAVNKARGEIKKGQDKADLEATKQKAYNEAWVGSSQEAIANGDKYFNEMKLSLFSARILNLQANGELNQIARAIDQSVMGLYMRDRFAGLLNSDAMCSAVKQCPNPREIKGSDLEKVFTGKLSTPVQSVVDAANTATAKAAAAKAGAAKVAAPAGSKK